MFSTSDLPGGHKVIIIVIVVVFISVNTDVIDRVEVNEHIAVRYARLVMVSIALQINGALGRVRVLLHGSMV